MANKLKKKTQVQKVVKKQRVEAAEHGKKAVKVATNFSIPTAEFSTAVGRRKTATARVRIYKAAGDFVVNDKLVSEYFAGVLNAQSLYTAPFTATDTQGKYAVTVKVSGSGVAGQLDAMIHGIARALDKMNPDFHPLLKKTGLLTRDDRMRETRKIGTGGKARRTKQSPKR